MIKNISIYLALLLGTFIFNIFYYGWFSWFLLLIILVLPVVSLVASLPFMIITALKGIVVFSKDKIKIGEDFYLGVCGKRKTIAFVPRIKINIKVKNKFAKTSKKVKVCYGGSLKKPYYEKHNSFSRHCGMIEADAKFCKIYDLLGIFFIPVKINCHLNCCVLPHSKKPEKFSDKEIFTVIGYKPKLGGGYSESYDLRPYQSGDKLKNIHWKLSSKLNDIIVREPTEEIYRQLIIRARFSENSSENDDILARVNYICRHILKSNPVCYCSSSDKLYTCEIHNLAELEKYFYYTFCGNTFNECAIDKNCILLNVLPHGEGVSNI